MLTENQKHYQKYRERMLVWFKRNQQRHIRNGYCRECYEAPKEGAQVCALHSQKNTAKLREWRRANRAKGLCSRCTAVAVPDKSMCQFHLDQTAEKARLKRKSKAAAKA